MCSQVLLERRQDELAVGPTFSGWMDPCLECFLKRRRASRVTLGEFDLAPGESEAVRDHQVIVTGAALRAHRFIPLPTCACERATDPVELADTVSERTGLVGALVEWRADGWTHVVAFGSALVGSGGVRLLGDGRGSAAEAALARRVAVVEALERYAAGWWDHSDATIVADGLVQGVRVSDGAIVALPADRVFLPYPDSDAVQDSVGLAAAETFEVARTRAVAELIERRVFWEAVEGRCAPSSTTRATSSVVVTWEAPMGHTVACAMVRSEEGQGWGIGLGCSTHEEEAIAKARRECRLVVGALSGRGVPEGADRFDKIARYLADHEDAVEWFADRLSSGTSSAADTMSFEIGTVDVTTGDVAAVGLRVARAVQIDAWSGPTL